MKFKSSSFFLKIAAIGLALSFGVSAYAEMPREELVHAYHLLKTANSNYAGHRATAIKEVEAAGRSLGLELGGDVSKGERQWLSDKQMSEAQRLLRDARDKLETSDRTRVARHLEVAIKEVDAALAVK
jgi:hypothetical protein